MPQFIHRHTGTGPVEIGTSRVFAYWESREDTPGDRRWTVRVSLDECDYLGLPPYQRVRLHVPGNRPVHVIFTGTRDYPPFALLHFGQRIGP